MTALLENDQKPMALSKNNNDRDKWLLFKECHDFAFKQWSPFLIEAAKDHRFALGDQWNGADKEFLARQGRNALVFNRSRRNIKMVAGYERKTRHSIIASPVENQDDVTASQLSSSLLWSMQFDNMNNTASDAFEGCLKTGINLMELSLDYNQDPVFGDARLTRIPYNAFLLDPRFTKRDLSDCEYVLHRRLLSKAAAKRLMPFRSEEIDKLRPMGSDGQFSGMHQYPAGRDKAPIKYDEFWLRTTKTIKVLVDMETGEMKEYDPRRVDIDRLKRLVAEVPRLQLLSREVPSVELNVFIENELMFEGEDPLKLGDFPLIPVMAFWDPEYSSNHSALAGGAPGSDDYGSFYSSSYSGDYSLKLQSLVRCTRDPQTEANKRRSKMLDIIDSQINTGWQAMSGSVVNPKDMYQSGQGKVIWMEEGFQLGDAQKIQPPDIPAGLFNLSTMMDQDIVEIAGITDELLGMQEDGNLQMSGVLAKLRQGAGLTVLQDLFDNFRYSQKLLGEKLSKLILHNWSAEKIARITNEEPSQEFRQPGEDYEEFKTRSDYRYDIVVEEALETPTQRALAYAQLMQAREIGIAIPDDILIEYMPLTDKKPLMEAVERANQQQQALQESQLEDEARLRELQRAKVFADVGLGVERIARAEADRGLAEERQSEFIENMAQAALARAKAITEIESMDADNLIKLTTFMREQETIDRQIGENTMEQKRRETEQEFSNLVSSFQLPAAGGLGAQADQQSQNL